MKGWRVLYAPANLGPLNINTQYAVSGWSGTHCDAKFQSVIWFSVIFRQKSESFEDLIIWVLYGGFYVYMSLMGII